MIAVKKFLAKEELRFTAHFVFSVLVFFVIIFAGGAIIDPWGQLGTGLVRPLVLTNRSEKLKVLAGKNPAPETIILGSSRVFEMNPLLIEELTKMKTYNGSVSYARPEEYLAMAKYIVNDLNIRPKIFVVGFNTGEFNDDKIDPQTITNPHLRRYLDIPRREIVLTLVKTFKQSITPRYIADMARALFWQTRGFPRDQVLFDENGYQILDPNYKPEENSHLSHLHAAKDLFDSTRQATDWRKNKFKEFLKFSGGQGVRIVMINLPMPAEAKKVLTETTHYTEYTNDFNKFINELLTQNKFDYFDFSSTAAFNGNEKDFNDSTHPNHRNLDKIVRKVFNYDLQ